MAGNPWLIQQDPTLQSAMMTQLLSGGALDPRLSSPVAGEAFAKGLQMSPADMSMLGKGVAAQGLEGQLSMAGTGQGPAGDVSRALLAMQQGFDQQRFQPRFVGGRDNYVDIPEPDVPVVKGTPYRPLPKMTGVVNPQAPPTAPVPDWVRQFQHALRVAEDFESTQNRVKQNMAGAGAGALAGTTFGSSLGAGSAEQFTGHSQMQRFKGAHSPEQAFALAFFGEIPRNPLGDPKTPMKMDKRELAKEALRAWATGDKDRAGQYADILSGRQTSFTAMGSTGGRRAMESMQRGTALGLAEELGSQDAAFKAKQLASEIPAETLQRAFTMLRNGADREEVKLYLIQNNPMIRLMQMQAMNAANFLGQMPQGAPNAA